MKRLERIQGSMAYSDYFDLDRDSVDDVLPRNGDALSGIDVRSMTTSQYEALLESELERKWILNLSMHFRDKSRREKFFVTYRQHEHHWRRVTISLDYRNAPAESLEAELSRMEYQRDKSAKIYEAIRESLNEIDFYPTVTNLKLETKDGRLHVHVVEDVNVCSMLLKSCSFLLTWRKEIIHYPSTSVVEHVNCRRVKEREIHFDSHISGFVYKVRVHGRVLIKKEIPGPETVDEFLYEINALNQLCHAKNVIQFYGVVVDDREQNVTGLLISYAARGALIDVIYDNDRTLPWPTREKWARQIVAGLSEIHEAGFVQGDFTLSNIVIDENDDAKIIDINRRGCPIGWEPPEATPLVESGQRITMYIGVKSDLYQLGMVLWALATQEDEPEKHSRPLRFDRHIQVPEWYRRIVDTCLSPSPRSRLQAIQLLRWFPDRGEGSRYGPATGSSMSLNGDGNPRHDYLSPNGMPRTKTVPPPSDWTYVGSGNHQLTDEPFYYPDRGRSPPSPMPSNQGDYGQARCGRGLYSWSDTYNHVPPVPSVSDVLSRAPTEGPWPGLVGSEEMLETYADGPYRFKATAMQASKGDDIPAERGRSLAEKPQFSGERRRAEDGVEGDDSVPTATEGMPPNHRRLAERPGLGSGGGGWSRESVNRGSTGPLSQADSGKDVTEVAGSPAGKRILRSVYQGSSRGSSPPRPCQGRPTTTREAANTNPGATDEPARGRSRFRDGDADAYNPRPLSAASNPLAGFRQTDNDCLAGIGAAYDIAMKSSAAHGNDADEKRPAHMMILEDDDDLDLDDSQSLRNVLSTTDRKGQSSDDRHRGQ
jgi:serine/threonine protein kinase